MVDGKKRFSEWGKRFYAAVADSTVNPAVERNLYATIFRRQEQEKTFKMKTGPLSSTDRR